MKIEKVEIHNLKAIHDLSVDLNGKHILITADNGIGKTSFLQAIYAGLGIKKMAPPVTEGEQTGNVQIWTDEGYEFKSELDSTKGVTKVSVKLPNERLWDTRVSAVGTVVGDILFDPFEFAELSKTDSGKKEQIEIVKSLLTDDIRQVLAKMERQIKANEESRTESGRDLKRVKGAVESKNISQDDIQKYREPIKIDDLLEQKRIATDINNKIKDVQTRFNEREEKIQELKIELQELEEKQKQARTFLSSNTSSDTSSIDTQISEASEHNTMVSKVSDYQKEYSAYLKLEEEYGESTALIESQREAYKNAIRSLDLPIPELTFDEDQLTYNGRAVNPNVMATSEIMYLGVMIKIAKNPGVNVLVVERGESLGTQKLNDLIELGDSYGFQLLVEQVVRGQKELKIEFLTKSEQ